MEVHLEDLYKGQILYVNGKKAKVTGVIHTFGGVDAEFYIYDSKTYTELTDEDVLTDRLES